MTTNYLYKYKTTAPRHKFNQGHPALSDRKISKNIPKRLYRYNLFRGISHYLQ